MPPGLGSRAASMPFHFTIFTGSVKKLKTISGLAAIRTSRSTTSGSTAFIIYPPLLSLRRHCEAGERIVPELLEEGPKLRQRLRTSLVEVAGAKASLADEAGSPQHLQV